MSYLDVFQRIKSLESAFPLPIDYFTIDMGTFDAATGAFAGRITHSRTDPEPIEHGPHQHPSNPKPHFQGEFWVSTTIDSRWRKTLTRVPAPKVGLVPVLLKFNIKNQGASSWAVVVAGETKTVRAGQSSILINIWDHGSANWSVKCGAKSYTDRILIQRSAVRIVGAGAFSIPVLPLSIIYAPPADAAGLSKAVYETSESVGTTTSLLFSNEASSSKPSLPPRLSSLKNLQSAMNGLSALFGESEDPTMQGLSQALGKIAAGIGTISGTVTTGTVDEDSHSLTITESRSQTLYAETKNGGPGAGDAIHYLRDAKFAWLMADGELQISLLGASNASYPAAYLIANASDPSKTQLSPELVQQLLSLDPFVAGGSMTHLPADRFEDMNSLVGGPFEYGGGQTLSRAYEQTFATTDTRAHTSYTSHAQDFEPGWLSMLFGAEAEGLKTTLSVTQAAGTSHTETQSFRWDLHSGTNERFVVSMWRDRIFGTYAFTQEPVSATARIKGVAKGADGLPLKQQRVQLQTPGKIYSTITDEAGRFAFFAQSIVPGKATLLIPNQTPQSISIS